MKYLVLAYGAAKDWNALTKKEQDALLAQDEVLRARGDLVAAVQQTVTTVRAGDGTPVVTRGDHGGIRRSGPAGPAPLVGPGRADESRRIQGGGVMGQ